MPFAHTVVYFIAYGHAWCLQRAPPPRAVDFRVPPGVRVVTVTGPNTGGKTASLKALGLAALMPKAGLFLPLEAPAEGEKLTLKHIAQSLDRVMTTSDNITALRLLNTGA